MTKKKKKTKDTRRLYITERTKYFNHQVPSIDIVVEEANLNERLLTARNTNNWKLEAQTLMKLGQLMRWRGKIEEGDQFLEQAAMILRLHTFNEMNE